MTHNGWTSIYVTRHGLYGKETVRINARHFPPFDGNPARTELSIEYSAYHDEKRRYLPSKLIDVTLAPEQVQELVTALTGTIPPPIAERQAAD